MFEHSLHKGTQSANYTCLHIKFLLTNWEILTRWGKRIMTEWQGGHIITI